MYNGVPHIEKSTSMDTPCVCFASPTESPCTCLPYGCYINKCGSTHKYIHTDSLDHCPRQSSTTAKLTLANVPDSSEFYALLQHLILILFPSPLRRWIKEISFGTHCRKSIKFVREFFDRQIKAPIFILLNIISTTPSVHASRGP